MTHDWTTVIKGANKQLFMATATSELREVTGHGLTPVSCHPTQVNMSRLNPSQASWYSTYLPHRDGRLS